MATGTPLVTLRNMLKAEVGITLLSTSASQADSALNTLLSNKQKWLSVSFDFPYLIRRWTVNVAPQSRYLPLPNTDIQGLNVIPDIERPMQMMVYYNAAFQDVCYGINEEEYNYRN